MNDDEAEIWRKSQIASTNYRRKLAQARERNKLSQREAANLMPFQVGVSGYYDIESRDGDLTYCYSLNEVVEICKVLDIHPRDLFCDHPFPVVSISQVMERIRAHCREHKLSVTEFESVAGWLVESCLDNHAKALNAWNVDCLVDVCRELEIDWRCVIESL
jgi:DNA-binding XRE family transcriptional regulator